MKLETKLKELQHSKEGGIPDSNFVTRNRAMLLAHIGREQEGSPTSLPGSIFRRMGVFQYFVSPRLVYIVATFVVFFATGTLATVSRSALPGEALYGPKRAFEKTHVRLVSNPAERARVQMEIAGRRLEEARLASPEQAVKALANFSKDVQEVKATLKQASDPAQIEEASQRIVEKAQEYSQKLQDAPIRSRRQVGVATVAIEEAEKALQAVTQEVVKAADEKRDSENDEHGEDAAPEDGAPLEDGEVGI